MMEIIRHASPFIIAFPLGKVAFAERLVTQMTDEVLEKSNFEPRYLIRPQRKRLSQPHNAKRSPPAEGSSLFCFFTHEPPRYRFP